MADSGAVDWAAIHARIQRASEATARLLDPGESESQRILDERARALARPLPVVSEVDRIELACFGVGEERFAVETRFVAEVGPMPEPEPIPWAPAVFRGVVNHRGEALPVVDLTMLLTGAPAAGTQRRLLVLGDPLPELGIAIDTADHVVSVPHAEIRRDGLPDALRRAALARGAHVADAVIRVVLDGAELLRDPRLFLLEAP